MRGPVAVVAALWWAGAVLDHAPCSAFQTARTGIHRRWPRSSARRLAAAPTVAAAAEETGTSSATNLVTPLSSQEAFAEATKAVEEDDSLVVVKFYAPWCRACRGLEPKYKRLSAEYSPKRVKFFEVSHKELTAEEGGTDFLHKLEVNVLPLVHFYAGGTRVEAFPCGPRKIELLRDNLEKWTNWKAKGLDPVEAAKQPEKSGTSFEPQPKTDEAEKKSAQEAGSEKKAEAAFVDDRRRLRRQPATQTQTTQTTTTTEEAQLSPPEPENNANVGVSSSSSSSSSSEAKLGGLAAALSASVQAKPGDLDGYVSQESLDRAAARKTMGRVPLLSSLNSAQLDSLVAEARVATYEPGDILISEGEIGRRFFVLVSGECDVYELSKGLDTEARMPGFSPDAMRTAYGTRSNVLTAGSYFGERGLVTTEPRAASIVAATDVRALAIDRAAFTKQDRGFDDATRLSQLLAREDFRWGYEQKPMPAAEFTALSQQDAAANKFSAQNSAPNKSEATPRGVDADDPESEAAPIVSTQDALANNPKAADLSLMQRLRLLRSVVQAFDQAAARSPKWGDAAEIAYRQGLVAQLTATQRLEFDQTFAIIDIDGDEKITVQDLASLMRAVGRVKGTDELQEMINKANPEVDGNAFITRDDFLALMAQAEFSAMFLEAFKLLDPDGHGWVESELLWQMMNTLVPRADSSDSLTGSKIDQLIDTFGVSDGHIDYQAFVKIMMTSALTD